MAVYNQTVTGGAVVSGCSIITYVNNLRTLYGPGDVVFNIHKARKGILEKIVIKDQRVTKSFKTYGKFLVMYVDTLNGLWNEDEIVPLSIAQPIAEEYLMDLMVDLSRLKRC